MERHVKANVVFNADGKKDERFKEDGRQFLDADGKKPGEMACSAGLSSSGCVYIS